MNIKHFIFGCLIFPVCSIAQTVTTATVHMRYCFDTQGAVYDTIWCGNPFTWSSGNGQTYSQAGTYVYNLQNVRGCDSTATLYLAESEHNEAPSYAYNVCAADLWDSTYMWVTTKPDVDGIVNKECTALALTIAGQSASFTRTFLNKYGCDSVVTITLTRNDTDSRPEGALVGVFSVGGGKRVRFARGNLQYCAAPITGPTTHPVAGNKTEPGIWRFARHQYDYVGGTIEDVEYGNVYENGVKCSNNLIGETYSGWIDLFGYGASGYSKYKPYVTSVGTGYYPTSEIAGAEGDWGVFNAISNAGNAPGLWRSLSETEWKFVLEKRYHADRLRGLATVNDVQGFVILPDDWKSPASCPRFIRIPLNSKYALYRDNVYYTTDHPAYVDGVSLNWNDMEAAGAVFFPAGGIRQVKNYEQTSSPITAYYTGSYHKEYSSNYGITVISKGKSLEVSSYVTNDLGGYGESVRLVTEVQ